jgi:GMP synthase (glutamine-hydrolysing)
VRPIVIVKTGSALPVVQPVHGDFDEWIVHALGVAPTSAKTVDVVSGDALPRPAETAGIVVTGSPAMVTDREPWSERTAEWLADAVAAGIPTLGICFGHQLLAHALGGVVGANPNGREIGTIRVELAPEAGRDPLLGGLPSTLTVHATHVESVLELPAGARLLAWSRRERHHIFRVGDAAWGVQFHPEFVAAHMRGYIQTRRQVLAAEGLDPDRILSAVSESDHGATIMRRFAAITGAQVPAVAHA